MKQKVILTGASGFIGFHCIEPLQRNYEVLPPSRNSLNLLDKPAVERWIRQQQATHLLHLAWHLEPPHFWNSPLNLDWHEASLHLIRCFYRYGGKRAVIAGTCAEYEWTHHPICFEKETPCRPSTLYGAAKLSLFLLAEKIAPPSLAWARIFHLFGPGEHPQRLVPQVIQGLLRKEKIPCSHGGQVRDYLPVQEAAKALVALLDSPITGAVNIGSGRPIRICDMLDLIAQKLGNHQLIQLNALPPNPNDPVRLIPNIDRLRNEVGWTPEIGLEAALHQTISWWSEIRDRGAISR